MFPFSCLTSPSLLFTYFMSSHPQEGQPVRYRIYFSSKCQSKAS